MTLQSLIKEVTAEFDKTQAEINLPLMKSKLQIILGMLMDEKTPIPGKLFDLFPREHRQAAMMIIVQMIAQNLAE